MNHCKPDEQASRTSKEDLSCPVMAMPLFLLSCEGGGRHSRTDEGQTVEIAEGKRGCQKMSSKVQINAVTGLRRKRLV